MSGFAILDLVIGLVFIFFVLSIITSSVVEIILSRLKVRSKFLTRWLLHIFDKKMIMADGKALRLGEGIMDHCLTTGLSNKGRATSFIDAQNFVSALLEKLTFDSEADPGKTIGNLEQLLDRIRNVKSIDGTPLLSTELMRTVLIFGAEAKLEADTQSAALAKIDKLDPAAAPLKNEMQLFREKLEKWYETSMERVSGNMKSKYIRPLTFWIAIVVVVGLNVDTLQVSRYLYDHKEEAKQFADRAVVAAQNIDTIAVSANPDTKKELEKINKNLSTMQQALPKDMPFGWEDGEKLPSGKALLARIVGWLATVMAIMLGAPFWFDLLNKIANIRGTGNKPVAPAKT